MMSSRSVSLIRLLHQTMKDKLVAPPQSTVSKFIDTFKESYDYVIVGAGAAGNVLANRLTEDQSTSVLLLEAGGTATHGSGYKTVAQERACRGINDRRVTYSSGGSTEGVGNLNYLSYLRGSRHDYDEWEDELGCTGWSYKDVLPYMIKSECNANPEYLKSGYHGSSGPMKVSDLSKTRLVEAFLGAGRELGYDIVDVNGQNQLGFSNGQGYILDGMRYSTTDAYRLPAMRRPNLDVASEANVRKILIDGGRATGIEILKGGQTHVVKADREVIVSAGAIESPRLLMLSGIGHGSHLDKLGIKVHANLPVGDNLQDHAMCVLEYLLKRPTKSLEIEQNSIGRMSEAERQQSEQYTKEKMARTQGAIAFLRTRFANPDRLYPDIQLQLGNSLVGGIFKNFWNIKNEVWQALYKHEEGANLGMYITTLLLHPKSTGTIRLKSASYDDEPLIDPKFLHHADDARTIKEGLKLQFQLQTTECFRRIGAELSPQGLPELPGNHHGSSLYSDEYLERFVRSQTLTGHHPSGTCKMGSDSDPTGVVDPELRVFGISGLRVVDASVMPRVPSGNTAAPTIMVAERAADLIRGINTVRDIRIPDEVLEDAGRKREKRSQ